MENVHEIAFGRLLITLLHIPTSVHEKENASFIEQVMDYQKHTVAALAGAGRVRGSSGSRCPFGRSAFPTRTTATPSYFLTAPLPPVLPDHLCLHCPARSSLKVNESSIVYIKFNYNWFDTKCVFSHFRLPKSCKSRTKSVCPLLQITSHVII